MTFEEKLEIYKVCQKFGYQQVMEIASELWEEKEFFGSFLCGPRRGMALACGCEKTGDCEWCEGTGWLTKKVKKTKDEEERNA